MEQIASIEAQRQLLHAETTALWSRIRLTNWAIRLCVPGALLISLVIVAGLFCLLRETGISASRMRQGMELALQGIGQDQRPGPA